jgi:hypothetical protein
MKSFFCVAVLFAGFVATSIAQTMSPYDRLPKVASFAVTSTDVQNGQPFPTDQMSGIFGAGGQDRLRPGVRRPGGGPRQHPRQHRLQHQPPHRLPLQYPPQLQLLLQLLLLLQPPLRLQRQLQRPFQPQHQPLLPLQLPFQQQRRDGTPGDWTIDGLAGSITVSGDLTDAALDFAGTSTVPPANGVYANHLNTLKVGGWISSSTLPSVFPVGTVTAGGIENSNLYLGVTSPGLPAAESDFESHAAGKFTTVTIKGFKDASKQPVDSFINSNIAAWRIGTLSFAYANTDDGLIPFGIVAHSIGKLTYRDMSGVVSTATTAAGQEAMTNGDFEVVIV